MKWTYALLCVLGVVLPATYFVPFLLWNGLNLPVFLSQALANPISAFFGADVLVSSFVLWAFIYQETRKRTVRLWWLCVVANLAVGVSLGFPLFLLLREVEMDKERNHPRLQPAVGQRT